MFKSLPSRERGLKHIPTTKIGRNTRVAPLAGAWIETMRGHESALFPAASLPSRERGLKLIRRARSNSLSSSRSPRGSVD